MMAAAELIVVRKHRAAGHTAHSVAVFVLMAILAAFSSLSPVALAAVDPSPPEVVQLTLVAGARDKGADFYNWNKVFVRYCDGASFSGDAEDEDQDGNKLQFRGLRIWDAVVDELMSKGMDNAKQVYLLPIKYLSGERFLRSIFNGTVHLQNVSKVLPKDCLEKMDPTECFFPAELTKSIKTPIFILNSDYDSWQIGNALAPDGSYPGGSWSSCKSNISNCTSRQIDVLHGFRNTFISELKTISEAVGDWYFGRRHAVKQIDCKYPCNPTCSSSS
nr:unnamed protein product [Digitaria exilis]